MVAPRQGWGAEGSHTAFGGPTQLPAGVVDAPPGTPNLSSIPPFHPASPEAEVTKSSFPGQITICAGAPTPFSHFPASGPDETMEHRDATQMA